MGKGEVKLLRGIFAPIPTPFIDEEIAYGKLEENLAKWGATGLSGIVVLGSNGEQPYVDEDEKVELWAFARKHFPETDGHCRHRLRKHKGNGKTDQEGAGAQAALILTPHYQSQHERGSVGGSTQRG